MDIVCNTDDLDKELGDKVAELNIIVEQMPTAIAENNAGWRLTRMNMKEDMPTLQKGTISSNQSMTRFHNRLKAKRLRENYLRGFIHPCVGKAGALVEELMRDFGAALCRKWW